MEIAPTGFPNWLALFKYLQELGLDSEQRVALCYPTETPDPATKTDTVADVKVLDKEVTLYVDEIKARAFEEIYDLLPEEGSVRMVAEMLETGAKMPGVNRHVRPAIEFLKKIPTRS